MSNTPNEREETTVSFEESYIDENILADKSSKTKEFIKKFLKRKTAVAAFFVMVLLLIIALIGPYIAPYDPSEFDYENILTPPLRSTGSARTSSARISSAVFWPARP